MLKKFSLVFVSILVMSLIISGPTSVCGQTTEDAKHAEKIKTDVAALGAGARVVAKLHDNKKLTGSINYIGEDFFVITDAKTDASQKLAYSNVARVERKEKDRFPKKAKIAIGILGVLYVMAMIANGGG